METASYPVCLEGRAMKRILVWFLPLMLLLGWVRPAQAVEIEPMEGVHYWIMPNCGDYDGTCARIAPNINLNTPRFAAKLGTTQMTIRNANRTGTIALCHRPGDGYHMGKVNSVEERGSDAVWKSCPDEKEQYVYVLPGQVIKIPKIKHLSFVEEERIKAALKICRTSQCAVDNAKKLGAQIDGEKQSINVHDADPIIAEIKACESEECAVGVAKRLGANIKSTPPPAPTQSQTLAPPPVTPPPASSQTTLAEPVASAANSAAPPAPQPSAGDKLMAQLTACDGDDACKLAALEAGGLGLKEKMSRTTTVQFPKTLWLLLVLNSVLCLAGLVYSAKKKLGFERTLKAISDRQTKQLKDHESIEAKQAEKQRAGEERIFSLAKLFDIPVASGANVDCVLMLLKQDGEDKATLLETKTALLKKLETGFCSFLKDDCGKELKQGVALESLWQDVRETAVGGHAEVKRAKTEAREAQEKTKAEALAFEGRRRDLADAHKAKVGRLNGELTTAKEALEKAQESFRDLEAIKQHFMRIAPLMPESDKTFVKIDNELTMLVEKQAVLHVLCDEYEASGDEKFAAIREQRQKVETRIQELHPQREEPAQLRAEFEGLYFRLTGFKSTEIVLYEEAQRDRNDAAEERGKAKVELDQAEATRTTVQEEERLLQERVAKFEAHQAEQLAILNSGKEAKLREWQDIEQRRAETDGAKLKAQSYLAHILQLMQDLLNQMELGGLTPEEFLELKRPSGIVQELARTIGGLKQTIDQDKQDLEAANGNYRSSVDRANGLDGEVATLRDELTKVKADLEQAKGELEQLNTSSSEQITKLQTVITDKQGEIDDLLSRMQSSEDSIDLDGDALKQQDPPKDLMAAADAVENPQGSGARKTKGYEEGELLPKPEVAVDFFQALRHALVSKEQIVVDSAEKVWLLFDLQRRNLFRFGLAGIFPEGLPDKLKGIEKRDNVSARLAKAKIPDMQWFLEVFEPNRPTNYPHMATAT